MKSRIAKGAEQNATLAQPRDFVNEWQLGMRTRNFAQERWDVATELWRKALPKNSPFLQPGKERWLAGLAARAGCPNMPQANFWTECALAEPVLEAHVVVEQHLADTTGTLIRSFWVPPWLPPLFGKDKRHCVQLVMEYWAQEHVPTGGQGDSPLLSTRSDQTNDRNAKEKQEDVDMTMVHTDRHCARFRIPFVAYDGFYNKLNKELGITLHPLPDFLLSVAKETNTEKALLRTQLLLHQRRNGQMKDEEKIWGKVAAAQTIPLPIWNSLYEYQRFGVAFQARVARGQLFDGQGVGKTIQGVAGAWLRRPHWPVVVVCPPTVVNSWRITWSTQGEVAPERIRILKKGAEVEQELSELLGNDANGAKTRTKKTNKRATGSKLDKKSPAPKRQRTGAKSARPVEEVLEEGADVIILSNGLLMNSNPTVYQWLIAKRFAVLLVDEAHVMKHGQGQCAQRLRAICAQTKYVTLLSGTPGLRAVEFFAPMSALRPATWTDAEFWRSPRVLCKTPQMSREMNQDPAKIRFSYVQRFCLPVAKSIYGKKWAWEWLGTTRATELYAIRAGFTYRRQANQIAEVISSIPPKTRYKIVIAPDPKTRAQLVEAREQHKIIQDSGNVGAAHKSFHEQQIQLMAFKWPHIRRFLQTYVARTLLTAPVADVPVASSVVATNIATKVKKVLFFAHNKAMMVDIWALLQNLGFAPCCPLPQPVIDAVAKRRAEEYEEEEQEQKKEPPVISAIDKKDAAEAASIAKTVRAQKLQFMTIIGDTDSKTRNKSIDAFQTDDRVRVAVLSIRAAGTGLTLTAAQDAVMTQCLYNADVMMQAEDRIYRITQTLPTRILYLLIEDSLEMGTWESISRKVRNMNFILHGQIDAGVQFSNRVQVHRITSAPSSASDAESEDDD